MGEIHVVQGPADCGKTSTIKEIFKELDRKNPGCIKKVQVPDKVRDIWKKSNQYNAMHKMLYEILNSDKREVEIRIIMQINEILIGIESFGDPQKSFDNSQENIYRRIISSLNFFSRNGCGIIFCAERIPSPGVVVNWVKAHSQYNIKSTTTLQEVVGTQQQRDASNRNHALSIITQAGL